MTIASLSVTSSVATQAYRSVDGGFPAVGSGASSGATVGAGSQGAVGGADFGSTLQRAMQGAVDAGTQADTQATQAIAGHGNITEVVTAVSKAELALQTTVALRDRVVQAYQDIMRMPI